MSKAKVAIVTDSTVNLPAEVIEANNIYVIPQILNWEGRSFLDQIDCHRRWGRCRPVPLLPSALR